MATKKPPLFRFHETFDLSTRGILETVKLFVYTLSPLEVYNVYVEKLSYSEFLAIKQFKADVVFKGEPDFILRGAKTNPHNCNTDVCIELISENNLTQIDSPTLTIVNGKKKYDLFVTKDDETFTVHISSTDSDIVKLSLLKPMIQYIQPKQKAK